MLKIFVFFLLSFSFVFGEYYLNNAALELIDVDYQLKSIEQSPLNLGLCDHLMKCIYSAEDERKLYIDRLSSYKINSSINLDFTNLIHKHLHEPLKILLDQNRLDEFYEISTIILDETGYEVVNVRCSIRYSYSIRKLHIIRTY